MQQNQSTRHHVYHQGDAQPITPDVVFGDEETATIGTLRVGDYLCTVPTQQRVRGVRFDSLITDLAEDYSWAVQTRKRGPKVGIPAHSLRTRAMAAVGRYSFPDDFTCTVRRPQS